VKRVGWLYTPYALPVAGIGAFDVDSTSVSEISTQNLEGLLLGWTSAAVGRSLRQRFRCAVFQIPDTMVSVLQIRAPAVKGHEEAFVKDVVGWATAAGFAQVVVLAGADATMRSEAQLRGIQLRLVDNAVSGTFPHDIVPRLEAPVR
jgi:hypothetical protein